MDVEMVIRVQKPIHGIHRRDYRRDTIHARSVLLGKDQPGVNTVF
jgi:hypothetical protein